MPGDEDQRIPNTTAEAHTDLSPEAPGVEDKQPIPHNPRHNPHQTQR